MNFLEMLKYIQANTAMYRELLQKVEPFNLRHITTIAENVDNINTLVKQLPAIHTINAYKTNVIKVAKLSNGFLTTLNGNIQRVLTIKDSVTTVAEYKDAIRAVGSISTTLINLPLNAIKKVAKLEHEIVEVSKHSNAITAYTEAQFKIPKALKQLELLELRIKEANTLLNTITNTTKSLQKDILDHKIQIQKLHSLQVTVNTLPNVAPKVEYTPSNNMLHFTLPKAKDGERGAKGERGDGVAYDAIGTLKERMYYNNRLKGFKFLAIDGEKPMMYIKVSARPKAWKEYNNA